MKRTLIYSLISLSFFSNSYGQENIIDPLKKNQSGLTVSPVKAVRSESDVIGTSYCKGKPSFAVDELNEIGITLDKFNEGVECTVGDFDGNGFLDFAFWGLDTGKKMSNGKPSPDYENYFVWFFNGSKVMKKIKIKTEKGFPLVYFKPRKSIGKYGEPVSKFDALWVWGETNGYDDESKGKVYLFDLELNKFKVVSFGKR